MCFGRKVYEASPATTSESSESPETVAAATDDCCEVCLVAPCEDFALVPCGDVGICESCADLDSGCPVCHAPIRMVMRVFLNDALHAHINGQIHWRFQFFYKYFPFMYSNWYSCLRFPDTTTLSLIAVTYSRVFHPVIWCHVFHSRVFNRSESPIRYPIGSPIIVMIWNFVFANKSRKLGWIWIKLGRSG